jgi:hypothetical protein
MSSSSVTMILVGLGVVAISVLGERPGFGVLSLYIIYCLTLSHIVLLLRVLGMFALIICHVSAIMIWNQVLRSPENCALPACVSTHTQAPCIHARVSVSHSVVACCSICAGVPSAGRTSSATSCTF